MSSVLFEYCLIFGAFFLAFIYLFAKRQAKNGTASAQQCHYQYQYKERRTNNDCCVCCWEAKIFMHVFVYSYLLLVYVRMVENNKRFQIPMNDIAPHTHTHTHTWALQAPHSRHSIFLARSILSWKLMHIIYSTELHIRKRSSHAAAALPICANVCLAVCMCSYVVLRSKLFMAFLCQFICFAANLLQMTRSEWHRMMRHNANVCLGCSSSSSPSYVWTHSHWGCDKCCYTVAHTPASK